MSAREHVQRHHNKGGDQEAAHGAKDVKKPGLDDDVDAILEDIDEVLEENAAEFVQGYVQKGGQ